MQRLKLWPKEGAGEPVVFPNGGGAVFFLAALPDGQLASSGGDQTIKLWPNEGTGKPTVLPHGGIVWGLAVLADGRLASGGEDGKIKLWPNDGTGKPVVLSHGARGDADRRGGVLGPCPAPLLSSTGFVHPHSFMLAASCAI